MGFFDLFRRAEHVAGLDQLMEFLDAQAATERRHLDGRAAQLEHDLALIGLHGIKRVMDIPVSYADRYVAAMSIYAKLCAKDASTVHKSTLYEYIVPCCPNRVRATSACLPKPSRLAWLLQGCSRSSTAPAGSRR